MSAGIERAVIFGCGVRGRYAYMPISRRASVLGFVDNDPTRQYTTFLGHPVYPPAALADLDFDVVYVASAHVADIRHQLLEEGIVADRIRLAPGLADASAAPPARPVRRPGGNALADYLDKGYHEIAGWLWMPALEATLALATIQSRLIPPGPVCEIGVWEGRYLALLSFLPATPQRVLDRSADPWREPRRPARAPA